MLKMFVTFEDETVHESVVLASTPEEAWSIWEDTKDPLYATVHGAVTKAEVRGLFGSERMEIAEAVRMGIQG